MWMKHQKSLFQPLSSYLSVFACTVHWVAVRILHSQPLKRLCSSCILTGSPTEVWGATHLSSMAGNLHMTFGSHSLPFKEQCICGLTTSHTFCLSVGCSAWKKIIVVKEIFNVCQTHDYEFLFLLFKYPLEYVVDEYLITCLCGLAVFSGILFGEVKVGPECEVSFVNAWG